MYIDIFRVDDQDLDGGRVWQLDKAWTTVSWLFCLYVVEWKLHMHVHVYA